MTDYPLDSSATVQGYSLATAATRLTADAQPSLLQTSDSVRANNVNGTAQECHTGMDETSASLAELIKTVERFGTVMSELHKLCGGLGLSCDHSSITDTFSKIQEVFGTYKEMAENERKHRTETQSNAETIQTQLHQSERDKVRYASMIRQQEQQLVNQSQLINQLKTNIRQAEQQKHSFEERFIQELAQERKNRSKIHRAYLDAESKTAQLECARRKAELACQEAVNVLEQQRTLFRQTQVAEAQGMFSDGQLATGGEHVETEPTLPESSNAQLLQTVGTKLLEDQMVANLTAKTTEEEDVPSSSNMSTGTRIGDQWSLSSSGSRKNMARSLLLPQPSTSNEPSSFLQHHFQTQTLEHLTSPPSTSENQRTGDAPKFPTSLPQSVVSGPVILGNNYRSREGGRPHFAGWSPGSSDLVIHSESSDSATADDHLLDGFNQLNHGSAARVNSYDFGGSSSVPMTDDYDSVNGSHFRFNENAGQNPLIWVWERKRRVLRSVRSGVSSAARRGVELSKSVWPFAAAIAAVIVRGTTIDRGSGIDATDFSDTDEDIGDNQSISAFMG